MIRRAAIVIVGLSVLVGVIGLAAGGPTVAFKVALALPGALALIAVMCGLVWLVEWVADGH